MPLTPLMDALHAQLAARAEAGLALLLVFGPDYEQDIAEVVTWVFEPHGPDPLSIADIERDTRALHNFTNAVTGHMTWADPGGGW